jgi:hypothetical protein
MIVEDSTVGFLRKTGYIVDKESVKAGIFRVH